MLSLVGEVSSSSWCLGWAVLFYCGTPWAFHIIILVLKFNVGLKSLLHQGLSEPEFYGDLVYKFKKNMDRTNFSDQFPKITIRNKRIGYDLNVIRQSACIVIKPITVDNFAALFNCTPVDQASDSLMVPT